MSTLAGGMPYWWGEAACANEDTETFYPPEGSRGKRRESYVNVARTICGRCKVDLECLADALKNDEQFGVFGACDMEKLNDTQRAILPRWVAAKMAERDNNRNRQNGSSPWSSHASSEFTPSTTQSW